jgi:peptidoglycan/xylan/chitin deacetylase (PgdA/CDA1 family)
LLAVIVAPARGSSPAAPSCVTHAPGGQAQGWDALAVASLHAWILCATQNHERAIRAHRHSLIAIDPLRGPPPRALLGRVPSAIPTRRRVVALTFDAGGDDRGLPRIYKTLTRLHATATFFMTGHFASYYPGWARRVASRFPICNHTMNHTDLVRLTDAEVRAEVDLGQRTIRRADRTKPQPLFRFPYGTYNTRTLGLVNDLGYVAVGWTVDTEGWLGTSGGQSVASVVGRVLAALRPGEIVLMHVGANPADGSTLDAHALASLIRGIRTRGYRLVSLPSAYAALYPSWTS